MTRVPDPSPPAAATRTAHVGVLGGTFDPIHVGHVAVARAARDELGLDEVLVIPAARPPHKVGVSMASAADRMAMVELALADEPGLRASRIEVDRAGPSWTVDTLEALDAGGGTGSAVELTLILSADAFAGLPNWHDPERILRLARVAVAPRPGHRAPSADELSAELRELAVAIVVLDGPNIDVSATDIRRRVAAGLPIDGLVAPAVARYIEEHHLYRQPGLDSRPASSEDPT
jgi:nicotinate-nucleotide adenylyltransferase